MKIKNSLLLIFILSLLASLMTLIGCSDKSISFGQEELLVHVGEEVTLAYNANGISEDEIVWSSSNIYVASVENGVVMGKATGECEIFAKTGSSSTSLSVKVVYDPDYFPSISFDSSEVSVQLYDRTRLDFVCKNLDATKTVWASSDASVASVENGIVVPLKAGSTVVTASNGDYKASIIVTVIAESAVPVLQLKANEISVLSGKTANIVPSVLYNGKTVQAEFNYTSVNEEIASVNENGVVTAHRKGETTVFINGEYNGYIFETVELSVCVKDDVLIKLSQSDISLATSVPTGSEYVKETNVDVDIFVNGVKENGANVVWSSENDEIASVDNGVITAKNGGKTQIVATYSYGGETLFSSVNVDVVIPVVSLDHIEMDLSAISENYSFTMPTVFQNSLFERVMVDDHGYTATASANAVLVNKYSLQNYKDNHTVRFICKDVIYEQKVLFITKIIRSYSDLASLKVGGNILDGYYVVANDFVCQNTEALKLVGTWSNTSDKGFIGTFDGRGHTISDLYTADNGVFNSIGKDGVVKNVVFANMTGSKYAITQEMRGTLTDVFITSSTKTYVSLLSDSAVIKNSFFVLTATGSAVIDIAYNSTCALQNVYGIVEKFIRYTDHNVALSGKIGSSFEEIASVFKANFLANNDFNTEYWQMAGGYPVIKSYCDMINNFTITNKTTNFVANGSGIKVETSIKDVIFTYSIKNAISGVSIDKNGLLTSTRPATITVVVSTPYGQSIEKTFTCSY